MQKIYLKQEAILLRLIKIQGLKKKSNLIDLDEDEGGDEDEDGDEDGDGDGDGDEDGDGYEKLPGWVGVSRKRFNEIKNTIKNYKVNKSHTRLLDNKTLYLTNAYKLIDRIDNLNPKIKIFDK